MEVEFMTADTTLPSCMSLPRAMLRLPISSTAKVRPDVGHCFPVRHRGCQRDFIYPFPHRGTGDGTCPQHHDREAILERIGGRRTDPAGASGLRGTQQDICTHSQEGGQPPMNEKLEKLNQEIEETEKKLRWAQQEEKRLTHQAKALTRKERTHRLCTRAAMLESYLPHPEAITDEQVSLFLKLLFHKDSTRQLMEKVFAGNGTEKEGAE